MRDYSRDASVLVENMPQSKQPLDGSTRIDHRRILPYVEPQDSRTRRYAQRFGSVTNILAHRTKRGTSLAPSTVYALSKYYGRPVGDGSASLDYPRAFIEQYKRFIIKTLVALKRGEQLDLGIAVLLTLATNLRSSEVAQLHFEHLGAMFRHEIVPIAIKKRHEYTYININQALVAPYMALLKRERPQRLVLCSMSYINRLIRQEFHQWPTVRLMGLRMVRKINSKLLLDVSDLNTVRAFNRHVDENVTAYYLVPSEFQTF